MSTFAARLANALFLSLKTLLAPVALGANALIIGPDGRVLLVRHGYQPGWRLPGGGVDPGETPDAAVRRELAEELNLTGGTVTLVSMHARKILWLGHMVVLYRVEGATLDFKPSWEIPEILWADPAAPPPGLSPAVGRRLAELMGAPVSSHW